MIRHAAADGSAADDHDAGPAAGCQRWTSLPFGLCPRHIATRRYAPPLLQGAPSRGNLPSRAVRHQTDAHLDRSKAQVFQALSGRLESTLECAGKSPGLLNGPSNTPKGRSNRWQVSRPQRRPSPRAGKLTPGAHRTDQRGPDVRGVGVFAGLFSLYGFAVSGVGGSEFWGWPLVAISMGAMVLVVAELASKYPFAGSMYQWPTILAVASSWPGGMRAGSTRGAMFPLMTAYYASLPVLIHPLFNLAPSFTHRRDHHRDRRALRSRCSGTWCRSACSAASPNGP